MKMRTGQREVKKEIVGGGKTTFSPSDFEGKWAQEWVGRAVFSVREDQRKKKSYLLIEFPYPSGERLHVGHGRSYSCLDAVVRKRRMQGENVMFPFGWDAFGLPAENYAVRTGVHPAITTKQNIENAKKQAIAWGLSFDWKREVNTTDPKYYKWTQWIFVQMFKKGLAYKERIPVNWCPSCKINLANEEVVDGKCERCGTQTERRMQSQWLLRITKYADRLLNDLATVDYREDIKRQQVEWIGRKEGINIEYRIVGSKKTLTCFTTTPVNFGATFLVVAPEHDLLVGLIRGELDVKVPREVLKDVKDYIEKVKSKSELDRIAEGRAKTGVFTGLYALNHMNGRQIPIWVTDFVLATVGTGAVQGCPGHDQRDWDFAKKFDLPIVRVVTGPEGEEGDIYEAPTVVHAGSRGKMVNSEFLDGIDFTEAMEKTMDYFEEKGWGRRTVSYHLRDWVYSRQHYWGEPIPMIYCAACARKGRGYFDNPKVKGSASAPGKRMSDVGEKSGESFESWIQEVRPKLVGWYPVPEEDLPVELPKVEKYQPSQTGESPLAQMENWLNVSCPGCGLPARRETDVMPNWGGSNWYFMRYCDTDNDREIASMGKLKYWMPVDWYNGGMEHTTLHLLYSRFVYKFLYDIGAAPGIEPYAKRTSHGVVLGPDGKRMSKSRGNVINPDEIVTKYGADTFRMYEMFIGPFEQTVVWSDRAMAGVNRFLRRVWELGMGVVEGEKIKRSSDQAERMMAKLVGKVDRDLEAMKFNTAVSACMEFVNWWGQHRQEVGRDVLENFLKVLAPMAPFVTEELWWRLQSGDVLGNQRLRQREEGQNFIGSPQFVSIHQQTWPRPEEKAEKGAEVTIVVQVNGKVRGTVVLPVGKVTKEEAIKEAKSQPRINQHLSDMSASVSDTGVGKIIWVEGKLINFVKG